MEKIQANSLLMKEVNISLVRKELQNLRRATKAELSLGTGLSVVTVNSIINRFLRDGEVFEGGFEPSRGGRPARLYEYNGNHSLILAIYVRQKGCNELIMARAVNIFEEIVYQEDLEVPQITLSIFEPVIARALIEYPRITAIGFGLPGVEVDGKILANDYSSIVGCHFVHHYESRFKLPVLWENDVNAAVMGYYHRKHKDRGGNIIGIYFPDRYGPGAGIMLEGHLYKGKNHFAGEVGGIPDFNWDKMKTGDYIKIICILCYTMAPDTIVIYRTLWNGIDRDKIREGLLKELNSYLMPELVFSDDFDEDYKWGTIFCTRQRIEEKLVLTKENW